MDDDEYFKTYNWVPIDGGLLRCIDMRMKTTNHNYMKSDAGRRRIPKDFDPTAAVDAILNDIYAEKPVVKKRKRQEDPVAVVLKEKDGAASLSEAKEAIKQARKVKMRTVQQYLCDSCDKVIQKPEDGFVVHGNIYLADPAVRGGLIGNNFPEVKDDEPIEVGKVKQTVLCTDCFMKALNLKGTKPAKVTRGDPFKEIEKTYVEKWINIAAGRAPAKVPTVEWTQKAPSKRTTTYRPLPDEDLFEDHDF